MSTPDALIHIFEPHRSNHGPARVAATPVVVSVDARKRDRALAMAADVNATTELNLTLLWRELVRGVSVVVDDFFSAERCYLVLASKPAEHATQVDGRRLEILEAVLGGLRQKNVAIDLQLAPSTVALNSRLALESLGVKGKPSRAHPLLMLAAKSMSAATMTLAKCSTFISGDGRELRVVSLARPDRRLQGQLPPAELAVIRLLVEGLTYQEIAKIRGTSMRTIANQITAVFRRMHVSGRNELVQRLFFDEAASKPVPQANAETLAPRDTTAPPPTVRVTGSLRSA